MQKKDNTQTKALIGYTGFIGSNLKKLYKPKYNYNTQNISKIKNKSFDLLFCAGTSSKRWLANKNPKKDLDNIKKLTKILQSFKTKKFILISSIEIYGLKNNKNENGKINKQYNSSYGKNRLYLENFIKKKFKNYLIIRLPIVYGKNFSKNVIYDLMYQNEIEKLNANDLVQIYNVKNLKKDIDFCIKNEIKELNMATEPILLSYLADKIFGIKLSKKKSARLMKMKSIHHKNKYFYNRKKIISELSKFIKN